MLLKGEGYIISLGTIQSWRLQTFFLTWRLPNLEAPDVYLTWRLPNLEAPDVFLTWRLPNLEAPPGSHAI